MITRDVLGSRRAREVAMAIIIRRASRDDAAALARIIDLAGEGLPSYLWAGMAGPGQTPRDVGAERARRDTGGFSWRNADVAVIAGEVAGGVISYEIPADPVPLDGLPAMFRPLQALENRVPGSRYINAIATLPEYRGRGIGTALMREAEVSGATALAPGGAGMSLIVTDTNVAAIRLYRALGYVERAREALVAGGWSSAARDWVLMVKPAALAPAS